MDLQQEYDAIRSAIRKIPGWEDSPAAYVDQLLVATDQMRKRRERRRICVERYALAHLPPCLVEVVASYAVDFGFHLVDRAKWDICMTATVRATPSGVSEFRQVKMFGVQILRHEVQHSELILLTMLIRRGMVARICNRHEWYECSDDCSGIGFTGISEEYLRADRIAKLLLEPSRENVPPGAPT